MALNTLVSFITLWDEEIGPQLVDVYPKEPLSGIDPETMGIQLFMTFENVFGIKPNTPFQRTNLMIPIPPLELNAKVFLETIQNAEVRGGLQPFIVVILFPDSISEKRLASFDEIMIKIGVQYSSIKQPLLADYYSEISALWDAQKNLDDSTIEISEAYSITAAVNDFKIGVQFFQKKQTDSAYPLIRKALMKFEQEDQAKLVMEATFLIATILVQEGKFEPALGYYQNLKLIAEPQQHQKYREQAIFMEGFCLYKTGEYTSTLKALDSIDLDKTQYINKFQFYSIQARTYQKLEIFDKASDAYQSALNIPQDDTPAIQKQRAQLYYELGIVFYQQAIQKLKDREIDAISNVLDNSLKVFDSASELWLNVGDYPNLIAVETLTANIYAYDQQLQQAEIHYRQACEYAEKINDMAGFIKLSHQLIQNEFQQEKYDFIVQDLIHILQIIQQNAFIDALTVGVFHRKLALAYRKLGDEQSSLDELIITTNIYNRLPAPISEQLEVIDAIAEIYMNRGEDDKANYYREQRETFARRIAIQPSIISKAFHLGEIKEVWIYYNTGIEMFSFAPETSVNPDLFGGFLSAMQAFSLEISNKTLNAMIIGEDRYSFYRDKDWKFFVLGRSNIKAGEFNVESILKKIHQKFRERFKSQILNFEGEVSPFPSFKKDLEAMDFTLLES